MDQKDCKSKVDHGKMGMRSMLFKRNSARRNHIGYTKFFMTNEWTMRPVIVLHVIVRLRCNKII